MNAEILSDNGRGHVNGLANGTTVSAPKPKRRQSPNKKTPDEEARELVDAVDKELRKRGELNRIPADLKQQAIEEKQDAIQSLGSVLSIVQENARELAVNDLSSRDTISRSLVRRRDLDWERHGVPDSPADDIQDIAHDVESLLGVLHGHANYLLVNRGSVLTDLAIVYDADGCRLWQAGRAFAKLAELFDQIFAFTKQIDVKRPDYLIEAAFAALPPQELVDKVISTTMLLAGEIEAALKQT